MRLVVAMVIVGALSAPAAARGRRCHGECPPLGIEYEFSFGAQQLSLGGQTFSNTITPLDVNRQPLPRETISVTGRNVGAVRPTAMVGELHLFVMHFPHLALGGGRGMLGGDFGKTVQTGSGALVNAGDATGVIVGPEARAVFAHGPLELRAGLSFGYREVSFDVPNRWVRCKGGTCHATVGADQFFFEPNVSVAVNLSVVSLGGYVGADVMPTGGWTAGGFVALRLADWGRLSDWGTWSRRGLYH